MDGPVERFGFHVIQGRFKASASNTVSATCRRVWANYLRAKRLRPPASLQMILAAIPARFVRHVTRILKSMEKQIHDYRIAAIALAAPCRRYSA
jgi:hypothetical protein